MTSCGQIEKLRWWGGCDAHNSHSAPPTSELYIQWVAYAMTVFVNCDLVRHAVRRAGPWSRVSDELSIPLCVRLTSDEATGQLVA